MNQRVGNGLRNSLFMVYRPLTAKNPCVNYWSIVYFALASLDELPFRPSTLSTSETKDVIFRHKFSHFEQPGL